MIKKEIIKKALGYCWLIVPAIAAVMLAFLLIIVVPARTRAAESGSSKGELLGNAVGNCVGSIEGITKGASEGAKAGEEDAINNPDVSVKIIGRVRELGKLEVLNVTIKKSGVHSTNGGKTQSLLTQKCTASFSVDLHEATITDRENKIVVNIPYPELDEPCYENPEEITSYTANKLVGGTDEGITSYIKSEEEIREEIVKELENDSDLFKQAQEAAKIQVKELIENISVEGKSVDVVFMGETENE